jgi:transposase
MNGVLWVLRTGAPWRDVPSRYPPYQTCHRRFQLWQRSGRLDRLLQRIPVKDQTGGHHYDACIHEWEVPDKPKSYKP